MRNFYNFRQKLNVKLFFDQRKILAVVSKANLVSLRRTGAYIRKAARNKVSKSDKASMPGNPPHTRRNLLKTSLLFGVDKRSYTLRSNINTGNERILDWIYQRCFNNEGCCGYYKTI